MYRAQIEDYALRTADFARQGAKTWDLRRDAQDGELWVSEISCSLQGQSGDLPLTLHADKEPEKTQLTWMIRSAMQWLC